MKSRKLLAGGGLVIAALIIGIVGTVLAQDTPTPVTPEPTETYFDEMMRNWTDGETFTHPMAEMMQGEVNGETFTHPMAEMMQGEVDGETFVHPMAEMMQNWTEGEGFVPPVADMFGMHGQGGPGGHMMDTLSLPEITAEVLGISVEEVWAVLESGNSIANLAENYGVDSQEIIDAALIAHQEAWDTAVAEGWLTAEEAAQMQEQMAEMLSEHINESGTCGANDGMMPGGPRGHWDGGESFPHGPRGRFNNYPGADG